MSLPIFPVTLPAADLVNGKLNACQLTSVYLPGLGHASMHPVAARAWNCLATLALGQAGVTLTAASLGDVYRTYAMQETVFRQRYRPTFDAATTTLEDPRYFQGARWYKVKGVAPVASPGTSNHGLGLAIDVAIWDPIVSKRPIGITQYQEAYYWLQENAVSLGWCWEMVKEPWHIRHYVGPNVTQRVLDVEAYFQNLAAAQATAPAERLPVAA